VERFRCAGQGRGIQKPERKRKGEARLGRCDLLEGVSCVARSQGKVPGQDPGRQASDKTSNLLDFRATLRLKRVSCKARRRTAHFSF